eukprot:CAMPEP_0178686216 /NCGR_PEP_ID=MMETSP0699-20121125/3803_1 /TAXON_ID=265572 /ORGANISM="Extubocellulus spinifer, Strain CCMP396" /LENGTH=166 /DNA_ID=CAMNT_0020331031 /DNA_START=300 /DNA_END=800 /DNA_ORIENTATION=-
MILCTLSPQSINLLPCQEYNVYCINSHYEYEKGRGVDQLSALRAACGPDEHQFVDASPTYRLECIVTADGTDECSFLHEADGSRVLLDDHIPELTFIHGVEDTVVQYNHTMLVVDAIHSSLSTPDRCREILLEEVGHAETVLHLMVGGETRDVMQEIFKTEAIAYE